MNNLLSDVLGLFSPPSKPAFAQVATTDGKNPKVRTVHVYHFADIDGLLFNTHMRSAKWRELSNFNRLSGCLHDADLCWHIRWEGDCCLVHGTSSVTEDRDLLDKMWLLTNEQVRQHYWERAGQPQASIVERCFEMGTVICKPNKWDVTKLADDYSDWKRYLIENGVVTAVDTLDGEK